MKSGDYDGHDIGLPWPNRRKINYFPKYPWRYKGKTLQLHQEYNYCSFEVDETGV